WYRSVAWRSNRFCGKSRARSRTSYRSCSFTDTSEGWIGLVLLLDSRCRTDNWRTHRGFSLRRYLRYGSLAALACQVSFVQLLDRFSQQRRKSLPSAIIKARIEAVLGQASTH